jgi:hypothetical protein
MTTEQRGKIAFEAFKMSQGYTGDWKLLTPHIQQAWCAAADAVYKTTQCYFDQHGVADKNRK